ncbi:MAG: hypothetical protein LBV50_01235 [Novosphingobium sp.]|nr:hypothetical protein [Novosphingobium sp.]
MNVQRGRLVSGGRLQVRPYRDAIAEVQARFRAHRPPHLSMPGAVDAFIAERRAEAERE